MIEQEEINKVVKSFEIESYLHSKGIRYNHSRKGLCFKSPFRNEHNPSSVIYNDTRMYHDCATGDKFSLVRFVMELEHCNFATALQTISGNKFTPVEQSEPNDIKREFEQKDYQFYPLQNHILLEYCASRGVSANVAQKYCCECLKDHKYFYVAFPSDKGCHVLRNGTKSNFAKINESGKSMSVTTINNQSDKVVILEGFFDFLSLVEYWRYKTGKDFPYNAIVLNSCHLLHKEDIEQLSAYQKIYTLLDNDNTGIATTNKITSVYADKCENLTDKFLKGKYNDFNDYWIDYKRNLQKI